MDITHLKIMILQFNAEEKQHCWIKVFLRVSELELLSKCIDAG